MLSVASRRRNSHEYPEKRRLILIRRWGKRQAAVRDKAGWRVLEERASGFLTQRAMYKPNFCAECGDKLLRLRWYVWTSRRFCTSCARKLRKERFGPWLLAAVTLLSAGFVVGRAGRPKAPPLTIIRRADSPLKSPEDPGPTNQVSTNIAVVEDVYMCGARTKKGTPCSRRVHGPVRCWQHKGVKAMLPQEKLLIKE